MVPMMVMIPVLAIALPAFSIPAVGWRLRHSPLHRLVQLWENRHGWLQKICACHVSCHACSAPGRVSLLGGTRRRHSGPTFYFVYDHEP